MEELIKELWDAAGTHMMTHCGEKISDDLDDNENPEYPGAETALRTVTDYLKHTV